MQITQTFLVTENVCPHAEEGVGIYHGNDGNAFGARGVGREDEEFRCFRWCGRGVMWHLEWLEKIRRAS